MNIEPFSPLHEQVQGLCMELEPLGHALQCRNTPGGAWQGAATGAMQAQESQMG